MTRRKKQIVFGVALLIIVSLAGCLIYYNMCVFRLNGNLFFAWPGETGQIYDFQKNELYYYPTEKYSYVIFNPNDSDSFFASNSYGIYKFQTSDVVLEEDTEKIRAGFITDLDGSIKNEELIFDFSNLPDDELVETQTHSLRLIPNTNKISFIYGTKIYSYDMDKKDIDIIANEVADFSWDSIPQQMYWIDDKTVVYIGYDTTEINLDEDVSSIIRLNTETHEKVILAEDVNGFGLSNNCKYLAYISGPRFAHLVDEDIIPNATVLNLETDEKRIINIGFSHSYAIKPSNDGKYIVATMSSKKVRGVAIYNLDTGFIKKITDGNPSVIEWSE